MRKVFVTACALLLTVYLPAFANPETANATQREHFLAAERAIRDRRDAAAKQLLQSLHDYPLYPYLRYQQLTRDISTVAPAAIDAFLAAYADVPISKRLRWRWHHELIRRQQWQAFTDSYQPGANERLDCHYAQALSHLDQTAASGALRDSLWLHSNSRPKACDGIFQDGLKSGAIAQHAIYERFKLAAHRGHNSSLTRYLMSKLTGSYRSAAQRWRTAYNSPLEFIRNYAASDNIEEHQRLERAYHMLARRDAALAADTWQGFAEKSSVPNDVKINIRHNIGVRLLREHSPRGTAWLDTLPANIKDTDTLRRLAFGNLLHENKHAAVTPLQTLNKQQPDKDEWRYWLAKVADSETALHEVALERSYYGFLAADQLQRPYQMNDMPLQPLPELVARIAKEPATLRTRELLALGRLQDARREWQVVIGGRSHTELTAAAQLADRWNWHSRAILTIAKTRQFDDLKLRFPLAYLDAIKLHSTEVGIDPTWALAVIRQESAFSQDIRSPSGALGLMQIMPRTAQHIARKHQLAYDGKRQLKQPIKNVQFGIHYLAEMLNEFDGHVVLATAAYNAGPNRVKRWLKELPAMDTTLWIEHIPFRETREYVKRVLAYKVIYAQRLQQSTRRLSDALQPIPTSLDTYSGLDRKPGSSG